MDDKHPLTLALEACVSTVADDSKTVVVRSIVNVDAAREKHLRMQLISVGEAALSHLTSVLDDYPGFEAFRRGGVMSAGNQGWAVTAEELPRWAVMRAIEVGAEEATRDLLAFEATQGADIEYFCALVGIKVERTIEVSPGWEIVPYSAIPQGPATDQLLGVPFFKLPPYMKGGDTNCPPPDAVLRVVRRREPIVAVRDENNLQLDSYPMLDVMDATVALGLVGPSIVYERSLWSWLPDNIPLSCKQGSGMVPQYEVQVAPHRITPRVITSGSEVAHVAAFLALSPELRTRLRLPLQRLRQSLSRAYLVDKAIELGVAFEALLIGGEIEDGLVPAGMQRTAVLIGGTEEERNKAMALYEAFYDIRSEAVHTGIVDAQEDRKVKGSPRLKAPAIVEQAQELCGLLLRRVISLGFYPDWTSIFPSAKSIAMKTALK